MDTPRAAVRLSVVVVAALLVALVAVSVVEEGAQARAVVTARDGSPFTLPAQAGVYEAQWVDEEVLVVVTTQARLDAVDRLRGSGSATDAVALPGGLAVFAMSARSTFMGCTGRFMPDLPASRDIADYDGDGINDGRFLDSCHQGQWDVFHRGAPVPGTPTEGRLAALRIELRDGTVWGSGFDGPVGGQYRA
jgi:Rieske Fe-S protein